MKCMSKFSENSLYKIKLAKTRKNVLEAMYQRPSIVEVRPIRENMRLRLRFKEAIQEAQDTCQEEGEKSKECHWAWYEVDELEDSMARYYPDQL